MNEISKQMRTYRSDESPRVGDVIQLFNDAFGTGVIVQANVGDKEYLIYRPHVEFKSGIPVPATEVYWAREDSLREKMVYIGANKVSVLNRNY